MKTLKRTLVGMTVGILVAAHLFLGGPIAMADSPAMGPGAAASSRSVEFRGGAGFGVPYGIMGGQLGLAAGHFHGSLGFGIVPLLWEPAVSLNLGVIFREPTALFRPTLTATVSNAAGIAAIIDGADLDALYKETYAGVGIYGGATWRMGAGNPWCLNFDLGLLFPFAGNDQIRDDYDAAVANFEHQGYQFEDEKLSLGGPKLSLGLLWSPAQRR